jgi:molybdopterin converting factor small subunit
MTITLRCLGLLRDYFGQELQTVPLPERATARDLLRWIEDHCAARFPRDLWDYEQHQFHGPVALAVDDRLVLDFDLALRDGCEVSVMYAVAGG